METKHPFYFKLVKFKPIILLIWSTLILVLLNAYKIYLPFGHIHLSIGDSHYISMWGTFSVAYAITCFLMKDKHIRLILNYLNVFAFSTIYFYQMFIGLRNHEGNHYIFSEVTIYDFTFIAFTCFLYFLYSKFNFMQEKYPQL